MKSPSQRRLARLENRRARDATTPRSEVINDDSDFDPNPDDSDDLDNLYKSYNSDNTAKLDRSDEISAIGNIVLASLLGSLLFNGYFWCRNSYHRGVEAKIHHGISSLDSKVGLVVDTITNRTGNKIHEHNFPHKPSITASSFVPPPETTSVKSSSNPLPTYSQPQDYPLDDDVFHPYKSDMSPDVAIYYATVPLKALKTRKPGTGKGSEHVKYYSKRDDQIYKWLMGELNTARAEQAKAASATDDASDVSNSTDFSVSSGITNLRPGVYEWLTDKFYAVLKHTDPITDSVVSFYVASTKDATLKPCRPVETSEAPSAEHVTTKLKRPDAASFSLRSAITGLLPRFIKSVFPAPSVVSAPDNTIWIPITTTKGPLPKHDTKTCGVQLCWFHQIF